MTYTGIILSTRERADLRRELFSVGISQISTGSKTSPGSYKDSEDRQSHGQKDMEQFSLGDHRSLNEVVQDVCEQGDMPSFCTACYRSGRTGDRFMSMAKDGTIGHICSPNAMATFKEYMIDFAEKVTVDVGEKALAEQVEKLPENTRNKTKSMINKLEKGDRDVFF